MKKYILALDQGTTSSRAILFDQEGTIISSAQKEIHQIYPNPGEVEHNPQEIWNTQFEVAKLAIANSKVSKKGISVIGIGNQRETTIIWDRRTGAPLYNAIVWQCRRTTPQCNWILKEGWEDVVKEKTGLIVDPYFSGTKIQWILDNVGGAREKAERGEALFGNVDSWLIWNLTGGKTHVTDYTNASRTMIFNIHKLDWDNELLELLHIPRAMLPEVRYSSEIYDETKQGLFDTKIPIAGDMGDQQAALFGQACFTAGMTKNTYGTGSFLLTNTGRKPAHSKTGLLTTIAAGIDGAVEYALEGSIFITGAAVQWLRDGLKLIEDSADSEYFARKVEDSGGIYVVPAFVGLGAPYWDSKARGLIIGITRGTTKNHLIRATLESIAFQVRDVLECMAMDSEAELSEIRVDGGAASNNFLMQFQADILGIPIVRPSIKETTALGVAYLAGLATDLYDSREEIAEYWKIERRFEPRISQLERKNLVSGWKRAVERSLKWES